MPEHSLFSVNWYLGVLLAAAVYTLSRAIDGRLSLRIFIINYYHRKEKNKKKEEFI